MSSAIVVLNTLSLLVFASTASSEILNCKVPKNFSIDVSPFLTVDYYNATLQVAIDYKNVRFYAVQTKKPISIRAKSVAINFTGFYENKFSFDKNPTRLFRITEKFYDEMTGNAIKSQLNETTFSLYDYRLILLPLGEETMRSHPMIVRNSIRRLAESCLEFNFYDKFDRINEWEFISSIGSDYACILPAKPGGLADSVSFTAFEPHADLSAFQGLANKVADKGLLTVAETLKDGEDGSMHLPNITQDFTNTVAFVTMHGHFEALHGIFRDLDTLYRSADVVLAKNGNKYTASCGIGLSVAEIEFPKYKLQYGYASVEGHIRASIDGIKLEAALSVDYSKKPCMKKVERIALTKLGAVKTKITGLIWPLNSLLSRLVKIITKYWKNDIVELLESKLTGVITQQLANFDCEGIRP